MSISADQLLEKLSQAYANCQTYADKGYIVFDYGHEEGRLSFKTSFSRNDNLFDFTWGSNNKVWTDGLRAGRSINGIEETVKSLKALVNSDYLDSEGALGIICSLLFPDERFTCYKPFNREPWKMDLKEKESLYSLTVDFTEPTSEKWQLEIAVTNFVLSKITFEQRITAVKNQELLTNAMQLIPKCFPGHTEGVSRLEDEIRAGLERFNQGMVVCRQIQYETVEML